MTRLAILSDLHGNLPALEAVLEDLQQRSVDGMVVAGDYTGGPHPVETIRLAHAARARLSLGGWMILGNGDIDLLAYDAGQAPATRYTHRQYALLRWAHRHTDAETLAFLRALPQQRVVALDGTDAIRVVHGAPWGASAAIVPDRRPETLERALAETGEAVLICGHTHVPWRRKRGRRLVLNPGAVCAPLDGSVGAQYALLTWQRGRQQQSRWEVEFRAVPYDMERLRAAFRESGLLEEGGAPARGLLLCLETGRNVWRDFLTYARQLSAEAGHEGRDAIPDEVWQRAEASFGWE